MRGSIAVGQGVAQNSQAAKTKTAAAGIFPAAAAAPTDPSFRDSYLNNQLIDSSRIYFCPVLGWSDLHFRVLAEPAVILIDRPLRLTSLTMPAVHVSAKQRPKIRI